MSKHGKAWKADFVRYDDYGAELSECGLYRYRLWRCWEAELPKLVWVMLNPSTAEAGHYVGRDKFVGDDPTIRKCVGFARRNGFGAIEVVNLFAFRATDPAGLRTAADPIGPENDRTIETTCFARTVVLAWGGVIQKWPMPKWSERARLVLRLLAGLPMVKLKCLELTSDGHPRHPLMLSYKVPLVNYIVPQYASPPEPKA